VDLFWKAVKAPTITQLQDALAGMQSARDYLAGTDPSELYLVHVNGETGGKSSSQLAETGNCTLAQLREQQLGVGLLGFLRQELTRLSEHAVKANASDSSKDMLPPMHREALSGKVTYHEAKGWNLKVAFGGCGSACAVTSKTDPMKSYTLNPDMPGTCSCGASKILGEPCTYEVFAARIFNKDPARLYNAHDTVVAWKNTYEVLGDLAHVSANLVHEREVRTGELPRMPLKTKPQKGRPKRRMDRQRSAAETARTDVVLRNRLAVATRVTRTASQAATAAEASPPHATKIHHRHECIACYHCLHTGIQLLLLDMRLAIQCY